MKLSAKVSAIATGVVPYAQLGLPDPITVAADRAGMGWMGKLIKLGAIAGLSSVILVMLLGQSRVFYSMSRDGLLPPVVSQPSSVAVAFPTVFRSSSRLSARTIRSQSPSGWWPTVSLSVVFFLARRLTLRLGQRRPACG